MTTHTNTFTQISTVVAGFVLGAYGLAFLANAFGMI